MIVPLEPPYDHIRIYADTEVERTKRVNAVSKERETCSFIETIPAGSVLWDVGSCVGAYALIAASRGVEVVAFEPSPPNYERLLENVDLNDLAGDLPNIRAFPFALSDRTSPGAIVLSSSEKGAALHHLAEKGEEGVPVDCYDIDYLAYVSKIPAPDYLKIDVDGAEEAVLRGGDRTLRDVQAIIVEVDDSQATTGPVSALCEAAGLRLAESHRHGESPVSNLVWRR